MEESYRPPTAKAVAYQAVDRLVTATPTDARMCAKSARDVCRGTSSRSLVTLSSTVR
jgi:hypothetical protein